MEKSKQLRETLNQILEIEAEYFEMEELSPPQKNTLVTKIVKIIKERKDTENDSQ